MSWSLEFENIAGIYRGRATLTEGVNAVRASNWQGKSSFLAGIETAFGTKEPLTEGESHGMVTLQTEDGEYEIELTRSGNSMVMEGQPYLTDEYDQRCTDLFAFLDEDNDVRRAVRNGRNLEDVLTQPLEIEDVDKRIKQLNHERKQVTRQLDDARQKADELTELKQQRNRLQSELTDLRDRMETIEAEDEIPLTDKRDELSDLRVERDRVSNLIDSLEDTIERTQSRLEECHSEYQNIEIPERREIENRLQESRGELEQVEQDRELLQSVYSTNEKIIEADRVDLLSDIQHDLMEDRYSCWVCGQETTEAQIEERLDALGDKVVELREEANSYRETVSSLEEERDEIKQSERRKSDLDSEISNLESTLVDREESLASAMERLESVEQKIQEVEDEVEDADDERSTVRSDLKYKASELEGVEERIQACTGIDNEIDQLAEERDEIADEVESLRTWKERIRRQVRERFDEAIQALVPRFETGFESARLTSNFQLVVARDGREVGHNALSEGEIELLGIIAGIAGYEAYDVADRTPIILLDQLGGLADENLRILVDYLEDRTRYLVLTMYPENSAFGDNEISPTSWDVVSPPRSALS